MTLTAKSVPHSISYSKNPIVFAWETDNYHLYNARMLMDITMDLGAGLVSIGQIEKRPNANHQYVFDISEILDAAISEYDLLKVEEHTYSVPLKLVDKIQRAYGISVIEYYDNPELEDNSVSPIANLVVKGGLAHQIYPIIDEFFDSYLAVNKLFLTWMPEMSVINPSQLISLFLYNWSGSSWDAIAIAFECHFYDETTNAISITTLFSTANIPVPNQRILMIPAGPTAADLATLYPSKRLIFYSVAAYNDIDRISQTITFQLDHIPRPDEKCFAYVNSLGGVDHMRTIGRMAPKVDFSSGQSDSERSLIITDGELATYDELAPIKSQHNQSEADGVLVHSGPKSYAEVDLFRDFRLSPLKMELLLKPVMKRYTPIIIDAKSVVLPQTNEFPFSYEFTYKYAYENRVYTPNHKFLT